MYSQEKIQEIFAQTTCNLKGGQKTGNVLAIGKGIVCFRVEGDYRGQWVPLEALEGVAALSPVAEAKIEAEQDINELEKFINNLKKAIDAKASSHIKFASEVLAATKKQ